MTGFAWEMVGIGVIVFAILIIYSFKRNPHIKTKEYIMEETFLLNRYINDANALWNEIVDLVNRSDYEISDSLYETLVKTKAQAGACIDRACEMITSFPRIRRRHWGDEKEKLQDAIEDVYEYIPRLRTLLIKAREELEAQKRQTHFKQYSEEHYFHDYEENEDNRSYQKQDNRNAGSRGRDFRSYAGNSRMFFFGDCKTKQEAKKVYRMLVKKFHPDNGGDAEKMQAVQTEYDEWLKLHS